MGSADGAVHVAFDIGPLSGRRTGVGQAVQGMHDSLVTRDDVTLLPFVTSFRARPPTGTHRLPLPALAAHRLWRWTDRPRVDRFLGRPDVVHGTNYVVAPTKAPRVVSVYDCWFIRNPQSAHPDVRRAGLVLARALARGAVVHASSAATAQEVDELFPGTHVVPIPLGPLPLPEPARVSPIPSLAERRFVLAIGTIERRKNLPTLVAAFGLLAEDDTELCLVLAGGDGDDRAAVDAAIDRLDQQAARRVLLTGHVDEPARGWLLQHASVLAYPSLDEGFGFPLLDAMQARLPIVASDRGSIPEVCGDAGLLSSPDDPAALAANLRTALHDDVVRGRLTDAAPRQLAQFSWDRCGEGLAALYRRLAAEGRR